MLTLEQKAVILAGGGTILSRFTAAVSEQFATIDKETLSSPRRAIAKTMFADPKYQMWALRVMHCAMGETNALTEKGETLTDDDVRAVVAQYLDMAARLSQ